MRTKIDCVENKRGINSFYVHCDGDKYYLFSQKYHNGVDRFFRNGVSIPDSFNRRLARGDHALIKTMDKMRTYIKYAEKYYGIEVFKSCEYRVNRSKNQKGML